MPDIKEKLVELLGSLANGEDFCAVCEKDNSTECASCIHSKIADRLIDNGVTIQQWISVEERLPEPLVDVLVHYEDGEIYVGVWFESFSHFLGEDDDNRVTHWMPLPPAPKGE